MDPTAGAYTRTIERFWGSAKWRNEKTERGTARRHLYQTEFLWRQNLANVPFSSILKDIKDLLTLRGKNVLTMNFDFNCLIFV